MSQTTPEWPIGQPQRGYPIKLCACPEGPYIGARQWGTPDCCERCGFMTPDQWAYIDEQVRREERERIAQAIEMTAVDPDRRRPVIGPTSTDFANDMEWAAHIARQEQGS